MSKCYQAYTHKDLDGAVSLLTLLWALPSDIVNYKAYNNLQIDNIISDIEHTSNPCPTFIMDMALRAEFLPKLDLEFITFIDHHASSEKYIQDFKSAKIIHKDTTSNALLMSSIFKGEKYPVRTDSQKMLIALADDFDCYRLKFPESYELNMIFWTEYKNNFAKFIKDYINGYKPFTPEQKRAIKFLRKTAIEEADALPVFEGEVNFGSKTKRVVAALTEKFSSNVLDILIERHRPDVFFFINHKSEKVCLRQCNKTDPIDIGAFAEKICEGGGHTNAAGGVLTPLFMEITKSLRPIK